MQQIDPVAFHLLGLPVYWYGIMIVLGMLLGLIVSLRRTKQYGISQDNVIYFLIVAVPLAIVGARFVFVVLNWDFYSGNVPEMFNVRSGGLSIHGGILGATLTGIAYAKGSGINFWRLADLLAPGLVLGQSIGRWGNFFNQEAYGIVTDLPWAMYIDGAWRHPTFLYEFIWNLFVFVFLLYVSKKETTDGGIFLRYLIWYSAGRFWIEGVRDDAALWGSFKAGQLISLILIHGGLLVLWRRKRQERKMGGGVLL